MIIGMDLGSTNSCAAVWLDGRVRMIEIDHSGTVIVPSVVTVAGENVLIGQDAIEAGKLYPDFDFRNFKRRLAEKWNENEDTGHQTCEGPGGLTCFQGPDGFVYSPVELQSYLVQALIAAANDFLAPHDSVTGVVVGVPARFEPDQIEATKEAVRLAGISNVFTAEEPILAAIANGVSAKKHRIIGVCDLGGGTLDVSCLAAGDGRLRVIAKNGIADLGGADFDRRIAEYVVNLWRTEHDTDLAVRDAAMVRILVEAEAVKKRLTTKEKTEFRVENIDRTPDGISLHMIYPIDRRIFEELTHDLCDRITATCEATLLDARRKDPNFSKKDINTILRVGGMTRVPVVQRVITEIFGRSPDKDESPEYVVAQGAAIRAAIIEGRRPDIDVQDITNYDIAIETSNNIPATVIPRGTPYPIEKAVTLSNETEGQTEISVRLLYASRPKATDCMILHSEDVAIEPVAAETARLKMIVSVNADGQPSIRQAA